MGSHHQRAQREYRPGDPLLMLLTLQERPESEDMIELNIN